MRIRFVRLLLILMMFLAAGCTSAANPVSQTIPEGPGAVKITLWALETKDPRQTILEESIRTFNQANRQIQIVPYFYETEAYKNKLRVAVVSGNMPDLFYYWTGGSFERMVDSQVVADLTPLLDNNPDFKNQFVPESLQSSAYQNRIYGIPYAVNHVLIWYNRQIFETYELKPPTSWNELLSTVQVLSGRGITPFALAGKERWPLLQWYAYLAHRAGGAEPFQRVLTREGNFTESSFVEAGLRFHELVKKKAFSPAFLGMDIVEAEKSFLSGQTAMYLQGDWAAGKLLNSETQKSNIGYFRFPLVDGKGVASEYLGGYSAGFAISANSNKQAAYDVLTYLMGREQRKIFMEYTGLVAPIKELTISSSEALPEVYNYVKFIENDPTAYFGFYDQVIEPGRAQQLLDAVVTFAGEEDMNRQDIEAILSQIR
jgi:raffinose/stachyose/melibiose transport system substrate-binding protein